MSTSTKTETSHEALIAKLRITSACQSYTTDSDTVVSIDDSKQQNGSFGKFHSKYTVVSDLCETDNSVLWVGKTKNACGTEVVVKRSHFDDEDDLAGYLENGTPIEVAVQKRAEDIAVKGGRGKVLKIFDWYVYDTYYVIVTEYDSGFESLYNFTNSRDGEHLSEEECKEIFLLLSKLVLRMNRAGIYHLDLKPSNVLYHPESGRLKLIDFGHSVAAGEGENPYIRHTCGTDGMITPQQASEDEECKGREVDEWGVAQVLLLLVIVNIIITNLLTF